LSASITGSIDIHSNAELEWPHAPIDEIIIFNKVYRSNIEKGISFSTNLKNSFRQVVNSLAEIHESQEPLQLSNDLERQIEMVYRNGNNKLCNEFKDLAKVLVFD